MLNEFLKQTLGMDLKKSKKAKEGKTVTHLYKREITIGGKYVRDINRRIIEAERSLRELKGRDQ